MARQELKQRSQIKQVFSPEGEHDSDVKGKLVSFRRILVMPVWGWVSAKRDVQLMDGGFILNWGKPRSQSLLGKIPLAGRGTPFPPFVAISVCGVHMLLCHPPGEGWRLHTACAACSYSSVGPRQSMLRTDFCLCVQGLCLVGLRTPSGVPGIEPRSAARKASALPAYSLWPQAHSFQLCCLLEVAHFSCILQRVSLMNRR